MALALAAALATQPARAVPYASGVTNNAGTVSFILNESADRVTVTLDGGASSLDLGPQGKGAHSFSLGGATTFQIIVRKITGPGWTLTSSDTNPLVQFNTPRGVAVNFNTNSPAFGRIYVANAASGATTSGRTLGDGIYLLNSDQSDALGRGNTASTAGLAFDSAGGTAAPGANSPWHIEAPQDGNLYIADFSTNTSCIYYTDADVTAGAQVLAGLGWSRPASQNSVHTTIGSSPIVTGSLAGSNLTVWAIDGRYAPSGNYNRLYRWNISSGPLPHSGAPTGLANPLINNVLDVTTDLDRGPDGKFYLLQNRANGNESGLFVADDQGINVLWSSLVTTRNLSNNISATDILRISRAVKVSPDGSRIAIIRDDLQTWVIPLVNGLPDLTSRELVTTYSGAPTTLGRDVCFDPAGNLYALSSGNQLLRVFSPGGATVATTGSDGTFNLSLLPTATISVVSSGDAPESGAPATFTFTRTGDTNEALTVNYTLTGTASNGVDYLSIPTSATIPAGASNVMVTITPLDDAIAELTESVVVTLVPGTNYAPASSSVATINIIDDEYPNVLIVTALDTNSFERFPSDTFSFRVTRMGATNVEIGLDVQFTGPAVPGADFSVPLTYFIPPGVVTFDIVYSPLDDSEVEGDETVVLNLVAGADYTVGVPGSATARLRDDELAPAPRLFADDFESDTSANWLVRFGANNGIYDATNIFAYDYIAAGVPLAPRSAPGTRRGLFVAVNKNDATAGGSAGINLYPAGQSFSGDLALRFDMFLSVGTVSTTEHTLAGLNHSTLQTNRVTQSVDANNTTRGGDGVWVAIETDASANREYTAYTTTNQNTVPVAIASQTAASLTNLITSPPFTFAGSPGNNTTSNKAWATVELIQLGNVITLKVNAATVFALTNTSGYTNGDIMIGHNDQFDSVGSAANYVIFDNVEVVRLAPGITGIQFVPTNQVQIDFASPSGAATDFHLQSTDSLTPPAWADDNQAIITATAQGYRAVTARSGASRYYRIRR